MFILLSTPVFGDVSPPPGVVGFNAGGTGVAGIGLLLFISNIIKLITIIAGVIGLFNVIFAGYIFLNSNGNPKATEQAVHQLLYSAIGLMIIVGSFTIVAIISFLLFGDAQFILNPKIPVAP